MLRWTYSRWIESNSFIVSLRPSLTALSSMCLCFSKDSSSLAHLLSSSSASYQDKVMVIYICTCVCIYIYSHILYTWSNKDLKKMHAKHLKKIRLYHHLYSQDAYCFTRDIKMLLWESYTVNINVTFSRGLHKFHSMFKTVS